MSRRHSPATGKRYPLRVVCAVWQVPRSSVCDPGWERPWGRREARAKDRGAIPPL